MRRCVGRSRTAGRRRCARWHKPGSNRAGPRGSRRDSPRVGWRARPGCFFTSWSVVSGTFRRWRASGFAMLRSPSSGFGRRRCWTRRALRRCWPADPRGERRIDRHRPGAPAQDDRSGICETVPALAPVAAAIPAPGPAGVQAVDEEYPRCRSCRSASSSPRRRASIDRSGGAGRRAARARAERPCRPVRGEPGPRPRSGRSDVAGFAARSFRYRGPVRPEFASGWAGLSQ